MSKTDLDKKIKTFEPYYKAALIKAGAKDIDPLLVSYRNRLKDMYNSIAFESHNIYPSMDVYFIYAVIAMCLELKYAGYEDKEIITLIEYGQSGRWKTFVKILKGIDRFPFAFAIARLWNINDHKDRVRDGSITYDYFNVDKDRISYSISKCQYAEMFSYYGIRPMCKIFCNTDLIAYSGLTRHVRFNRKEDLSDGMSCTDEILKI